ncbi:hypothetical protein VT84_13605 [Gemmata sp. SH-PL17]|uniref:hypothetical protein n=1 Tax=Gemmata sp. SH-PL17 TaxID=1630693 RepID=UPI00078C7384|nr:hypothetical protein [Gemmata sp. SH-PL17]AMV25432.1 hypothetical protein VT84_13605 [Gemmata sp. SH-PL17]
MATVAENLQTAIANVASKLATESANPQPSYSLDGKSFSWNEYRESLVRQLEALQKAVNAVSPYIVQTKMVL